MRVAQIEFVTAALIPPPIDTNVVPFRRRDLMAETSRGGGIQLLGEIHGKVELLLEQMREDRIERRATEERVRLRLDMAYNRIGEIERRLGEVETSSRTTAVLVSELQAPVRQMVELRGRVGWFGGLIIAGLFAIWAFGRPIYDGWIAGWFSKSK